MACQCTINADKTVVVCDSCANQMMSALMGLLPKQDKKYVEPPALLTVAEHRGMRSIVRGWRDELEVARR